MELHAWLISKHCSTLDPIAAAFSSSNLANFSRLALSFLLFLLLEFSLFPSLVAEIPSPIATAQTPFLYLVAEDLSPVTAAP